MPELVDEAVSRKRLAGVKGEQREQRTLSRPPERDVRAVAGCLDRSEQPQLERVRARSGGHGSILRRKRDSGNRSRATGRALGRR